MPTITHFIIPADNIEQAKKFYSEVFGWKIEKVPGPFEYYEVTTINSGDQKGIDGGMAKKENPNETIMNYIDVESIDKYIEKIEKFGGKVVVPKMVVPEQGYTAVCLDSENNSFGLWQTDKSAKF